MLDLSLNTLTKHYVNHAESRLRASDAKQVIDEWLPEIARHDLLESRHTRVLKSPSSPEFIHQARQAGLLARFSDDQSIVAFQFDYLRDYFLAKHIAGDILRRGVETALKAFIQDIEQLRQSVLSWESVFKILINQIDKKDINKYIEFLSRTVNNPGLAHICLLELGSDAQSVRRPPALQLLQTIEDWAIPLDKRMADAHTLGHLDPRIPSVKKIQLALVDIPPSERMPRYRIGKYPVTNMEFGEFVDEKGYQREEYWTTPGWDWLQHNKIRFPLYWGHEKLNRPNYPVVGVSFFEAKAYCTWLSKRLQANFDLPSVIQWDRAAHGSEKYFELLLELFRETLRKGKIPDKSLIQKLIAQRNSAQSSKKKRDESTDVAESNKDLDIHVERALIAELISTVHDFMKPYSEQMRHAMPRPIGIFPGNAIGCHDFYGNVWEWTNTVFSHVANYVENVPTTASMYPGVSAFVKGGATSAVNSAVWTLLGGWFDPSVRFHKLGFRIVFR